MKKVLFGLLTLLWFSVPAHGAYVWQVVLADTDVALSSNCIHDTAFGLPDGTGCDILWDRNRNGRDDTLGHFEDSLALVCGNDPSCPWGTGQDTLNLNIFALNGEVQEFGRGKFFNDFLIRAHGPTPAPQWLPRPDSFYVRVCGDSVYWESEIFSPLARETPQVIYLRHWRCVHRPCEAGHEAAMPVRGFRASDTTYCDGVHLRWDPYPAYGDSIFLYRRDTLIVQVSARDTSYVDAAAQPSVTLRYSAVARRGSNHALSPRVIDNGYRCNVPEHGSNRQVTNALPARTALRACYPNPFNARTTIVFDLAQAVRVRVAVYDLLGREVATLASGMRAAGTYSVAFDGSNLPSGVYICRMNAGRFVAQQKLLLLK